MERLRKTMELNRFSTTFALHVIFPLNLYCHSGYFWPHRINMIRIRLLFMFGMLPQLIVHTSTSRVHCFSESWTITIAGLHALRYTQFMIMVDTNKQIRSRLSASTKTTSMVFCWYLTVIVISVLIKINYKPSKMC